MGKVAFTLAIFQAKGANDIGHVMFDTLTKSVKMTEFWNKKQEN